MSTFPRTLAFCVLPSARHTLTTPFEHYAGEEPIFSQLGLLGLLDTLGICDPKSPNLAGVSHGSKPRLQTAPAAKSCVLLVGDCGDSVTVHAAGCVPPSGWTVIVTFSPGRRLRVYWSHCATLPFGSFLEELRRKRTPTMRRQDMPQPLIQAAAQLEQGLLLHLLPANCPVMLGKIPLPSVVLGIHIGGPLGSLATTSRIMIVLLPLVALFTRTAPPPQHKYQPSTECDLHYHIAAFSAQAVDAACILLALPRASGWLPTVWYLRTITTPVPAAHDRTPVIFFCA